MITTRPARPDDVPAMSAVLTASILTLCSADHGNDPEAMARWIANKTPEGVAAMLARPDFHLLVAERDGVVMGVGATTLNQVALNYVSPDHRFIGVSSALLAAMEAALAKAGHAEALLDSTSTARDFYRKRGWVEAGPPQSYFGVRAWPMKKRLG